MVCSQLVPGSQCGEPESSAPPGLPRPTERSSPPPPPSRRLTSAYAVSTPTESFPLFASESPTRRLLNLSSNTCIQINFFPVDGERNLQLKLFPRADLPWKRFYNAAWWSCLVLMDFTTPPSPPCTSLLTAIKHHQPVQSLNQTGF